MISPAHVQLMASYNRWQNHGIYGAADTLSDEARRLDRGAFFASIHGTLNHLLWGDEMWLHRFAGTPKPQPGIKDSPSFVSDWTALMARRAAFDEEILAWAGRLDANWLGGNLTWTSAAAGREVSKPHWQLVTHFFNHQTHHRGQVHAMLTAAGARPQATDLPFMPEI